MKFGCADSKQVTLKKKLFKRKKKARERPIESTTTDKTWAKANAAMYPELFLHVLNQKEVLKLCL